MPTDLPMNEVTPAEKLYEVAKAALGTKIAPDGISELGCAFSVNELYKRTFGKDICPAPQNESTYWLYKAMKAGPFTRVSSPIPGDIIIAPTGYGNYPHGHVGYVAKYGILSNDSATGTWKENYTLASWNEYYAIKGGFVVAFFRPLGE